MSVCKWFVCRGIERGVFSKWGGCSLRSVARWGLAVKVCLRSGDHSNRGGGEGGPREPRRGDCADLGRSGAAPVQDLW